MSFSAIYGFDIETLQVYPPTWKDVMTYCSPVWISDYTYKKIRQRLLDEGEWQAQATQAAGAPQDYLVVSGKVIMSTQQVQLGDFYHLTSAVPPTGRVPGEYSIRLLGAGGVTLADYPFTPQFNYPDYPSPGSGPLTALISEAVLWDPGTTRVAIYRGAAEVAGRNVSQHTPVVTILTPHGGETLTGPFNVQLLAKHNAIKVIECNLRASRSFPFVSKVTGMNFAREATRRMLGVAGPVTADSLNLDYVGVKVPMFSFARLAGADRSRLVGEPVLVRDGSERKQDASRRKPKPGRKQAMQ
jgi:hypothetical protein